MQVATTFEVYVATVAATALDFVVQCTGMFPAYATYTCP
jgi:hypothetical protein